MRGDHAVDVRSPDPVAASDLRCRKLPFADPVDDRLVAEPELLRDFQNGEVWVRIGATVHEVSPNAAKYAKLGV